MKWSSFFSRPIQVFLLPLLCLASLSLSAQDYRGNWEPLDYWGIPGRDKHEAFFDEFENNANSWDMGQSMLKEEISNGEFFIATLTDRAYTKRRAIPMNQTGNYEVEIRMRYVKGMEQSPMGLTFGRDVRGNEYNFLFTPLGNYKIIEVRNMRAYDLQGWQQSGSLAKYSYNSLLVRKVSGRWYFFINEELVAQMPARDLFGTDFGFTVGGNMAIEVDQLRVSEIRTVDNSGPEITLTAPVVTHGPVQVRERAQMIKGRVHDVSGISKLTINGYPIRLASDGTFIASLQMRESFTTVDIVAFDRFQNETSRSFSLELIEETAAPQYSYVEEPAAPAPEPSATPSLPPGYSNNNWAAPRGVNEFGGKNYLVLIGVNDYSYWNPLHNAVRDCNDLAYVLTSEYQFEQENVITLYNHQATRENILELFEQLQERVGENDNLVIYYAGHGFYDNGAGLGYWVPVDARLNKVPDFIRNSTVHDYLRTVDSHHTLLIADACYAGSLFSRSRGVINQSNRSRWAFTSGDIEKVWDGQPGENSPFARYLIRYLKNSEASTINTEHMIEAVSMVVQRNTSQNPRGDALGNVGDEGGVFLFRRK